MQSKEVKADDRGLDGRIDARFVAEEIAMLRAEFVGAIDGIVCVTALLIAHLEQDGALKAGVFFDSLRAVLNASRSEAPTAEAAVITAVMNMLSNEERSSSTFRVDGVPVRDRN